MSSICMTFVPLCAISPDAKSLQDNLKESIRAGIAADKYSPALQKQFNIQLAHIDAQEPSCEVVLTQGFGSKPSKPITSIHTFSRSITILTTVYCCLRRSETQDGVHHDVRSPQPSLLPGKHCMTLNTLVYTFLTHNLRDST